MKYQHDLQVAVRERQRRLLTEHFRSAGHQVALVKRWIESQPQLISIIREAASVEPDLDVDTLHTQVVRRDDVHWPSRTEAGKTSLIWAIMCDIEKAAELTDRNRPLMLVVGHGNLPDGWREYAERVLLPLLDYLLENLAQYSTALHAIERYQHITEWFTRASLYAAFKQRTSTGEELYNDDLQHFLYRDAGYVTHAKVRSASGEVDLTGGIDTVDPLICEGKLFDQRGVRYIASGVHQLVQYAHDQQKSRAYLVIFNLTSKLLEFEFRGENAEWPPQLEVAGVTVNLIVVRALPPTTTASKSGRASIVRVTAEQLTDPDSETA